MLLIFHGICGLKMWGNQDLNPGPTDYEGGRFSHKPVTSNRYEYDYKRVAYWMQLDLIGL